VTPPFLHLRGEAAFRRFDHDGTTLHAPTQSVRLATEEQADEEPRVSQAVFDAWLAARGSAVVVPCRPDGCREDGVLLVTRDGKVLFGGEGGFQPWPSALVPPPPPSGPLRFTPLTPVAQAGLDVPSALVADPHGRLWLLERGARRVLLLTRDTLKLLDVLPFPDGVDFLHLATSDAGVLAADAVSRRLYFQPYGGEWRPVPVDGPALPSGAQPVAVAGLGERLVGLYRLSTPVVWDTGRPAVHALVALVEGGRARLVGLPALEDPLPLLVLPGGDLLVGEISEPPGGKLRFTRFAVTPEGLRSLETRASRGFDGRAFFLDADGKPYVTTATGLRRLHPVPDAPHRPDGRVETYALDSERYGCAWHRLFLEVCLPPGTSVKVEARTSDDLYPRGLRLLPEPPAEGGAPTPDPDAADRHPFGSRARTDVEGWMPVGTLDRRAAWADVSFPPPAPAGTETLEGLIKNPPGRYLWLRITLTGTRRRSPSLLAVRATYPRPSLLDHLPAFWRADPDAALAMDHALSLFEGFLTEFDGRIDGLRHLFDPRLCPPEALDWLAGFVALVFDPRLSESTRRVLLAEIVPLYRKRGTVPGLARLCSIIAEAPVDIVEGFRQRRRTVAFLGEEAGEETGAILGQGFQLGSGGETPDEDWEQALREAHDAELERRAKAEAGTLFCPPEPPPDPLDPDPLISFVRRTAHRFTVVVFRGCDQALADVLETAVERHKPAHTLHQLCWLEAGFRLGVTTYVGFGTRLARVEGFTPAVLGESPLGAPTLLSEASPSRALGSFVGGARIGDSTPLG
jgi:phage tail-like protein